MTTRSRGPLAGFGWLKRGIEVAFRHPKPALGGAAFLLLAVLVPALIRVPIQFYLMHAGMPLTFGILLWSLAGSVLLGLLIVPLYAGYLQVIDAAERGLPARARDIFQPYRQGEAPRLIGYGLAIMLLYIVVLGIIVVATGSTLPGWYLQFLNMQAAHQPPPALPHGFGTAMALLTVFGLFMMGFYSISLGQIALGRRGVFDAIGDGALGALKNLLPLLVLAITLVVAWIIVAIVLVIVVALLFLLGRLVSGWLSLVLVIPVYIALLLLVFAVMFGVMYHLWRDVCGDDAASGTARVIAG